MRSRLKSEIERYACMWCAQREMPYLWRKPVVRLADASSPLFSDLRTVVDSDHHMPQDFLPGANAVVSLFLPFEHGLAKENVGGSMAAQSWVDAYNQTNDMAQGLCAHLASWLQDQGCEAACVTDAGMISLENPRSRWSQRHVAYIAGQGSWGINNMLINDEGCVGRYYSLVAFIPANVLAQLGGFDAPDGKERCLYKQGKACLLCVKRCVNGALTEDGFDRFLCLDQCLKNERELGADVCGKCIVGLPCSMGSI